MMLQGKEKWKKGLTIKKLTHFLQLIHQQKVFLFFFFNMKRGDGWKF